jgi:hypothetical protein
MSSVYFILPILMAIGNEGSEGGDAGSGDSEGGDAGGGDAEDSHAGGGDAGGGDAGGGDAGVDDAEGSRAGVDDAGGGDAEGGEDKSRGKHTTYKPNKRVLFWNNTGENDEQYRIYLETHELKCKKWDEKEMARVKSGTWWSTNWGPPPICMYCHSGEGVYNKETGVCEACVSFQSQMFTEEAVAETQASVAKFENIKKMLQEAAIREYENDNRVWHM